MILVANDVGSKELLPKLSKRVDCDLAELPFGDFVWAGAGPGSSSLLIAVERKTWSDLISSLESGRLETHQVPGLVESFDRRFLLIEGKVRPGAGGQIMQFRGFNPRTKQPKGWYPLSRSGQGWTMDRLYSKLLSIEELARMPLIFTESEAQTCNELARRYRWWQKDYDEHKTFKRVKALERGKTTFDNPAGVDFSPRQFEKVTYLRDAASRLPGVGWERSGEIDKAFGSMKAACEADEKDWRKVDGIGKVLAKRIVETLRGEG